MGLEIIKREFRTINSFKNNHYYRKFINKTDIIIGYIKIIGKRS